MTDSLKSYLNSLLQQPIKKISRVSGGDISQAYRIETATNSYFLKLNNATNALTMFQTETYGLETIAKTNTIKTPTVLACDSFKDSAFLFMEFIESKSPSTKDFINLGEQLAKLHESTCDTYGLDHDNFIGRLPQSNTEHSAWVDFYTYERLLPQLELAKQQRLLLSSECPSVTHIKTQLKPLFEDIKPSLLHGDLWSGNYLISKNGEPYLIDPAVYYGHHEVDIAMSKLFGGFGDAFYERYFSRIPSSEHSSARIEIYQLYFLLVHLNMFGRSYYGSVSSILRKYF
ncbi:Fructosamine-3-kinase [Hyunsoonleella jejuensis]|uniref:Fructosamine-3-kinase n=1 Tax=Hyunsoonleella jejuensis TaxID=419940 RepID=A0A1H9GSZ6_9FLAO|nr:fructosamine kinase family protein [Hyunsoonleella jejuensis]SEQ53212.1 Fructosamine-3-kinase [Hyunsoonleella jejuensis]